MIKEIKGIKIELIIISIVLFALGLFLVIFPEISQLVICKAVGIALCVWGVLRLITYFRMAKEEVFGSFGLVQGISLLAFGIFFVMKPEVIAMFFGTVLAILIIDIKSDAPSIISTTPINIISATDEPNGLRSAIIPITTISAAAIASIHHFLASIR